MSIQPSAQAQPDITRLLHDWTNGNEAAFNQLFEIVYQDLRKQAHNFIRKERPGHVLQTTGLVNEVYLKLERGTPITWENRQHFRRICIRAMRQILWDIAKQDKFLGNVDQISTGFDLLNRKPRDWEALEDALRDLKDFDPRAAQVVELKFFFGMTYTEIGEELGYNEKTMREDCQDALLYLYSELDRKHEPRKVETN